MPRERKEFKRNSYTRETQKLFIITTEGLKTEVKYFEEFKTDEYCDNRLVYIEVLKKMTTNSSPKNIINQLDIFRKQYRLGITDELWVVIDRDKQSWTVKQIAEVAKLCHQKKYGFALSNPCFEAWLLLHRTDYNLYSEEKKKELFQNKKIGSRTSLELELIDICVSYNKSNLNVSDYLPYVKDAIDRAKILIANNKERWPNEFGSYVYKLVNELLP